MNREELFEQIGELDEELLLQSETEKKFGRFTWKRWAYIAACMAVTVTIVITYYIISNWRSDYVAKNSFEKEEFVSVQSLLPNVGGIQEQSLISVRNIPVGKHKAVYHEVDSAGRDVLWRSLGRPVSGSDCFYYVSGHKDMQYLISLKNNELSLWEFCCFQEEEYPYSDVLELVYDIHSADDIKKILSKPADIDNTDPGRALQEEIGDLEIEDRGDIETLYQILTSLTCLGDDHWELVDLGDDLQDNGIDAVWRGRYLSITTVWGNVVSTMKYTAFSNMFYEYYGIAYKELSEQQAEDVKRILQISGEPAPDLNMDETEEGFSQDVSSEYMTEVYQNIYSMWEKGELPFIAAMYGTMQPYRLHVMVTTDDEEELQKLRALDPIGAALEIEYGSVVED